MRVLLVLNGSFAGYSGGDLHTVAIANRWAQQGHEIDFYLPSGSSAHIAELLDARVRVIGRRFRREAMTRSALARSYAARTWRAMLFVLRRRARWDVAIASSHFAFDLLPIALVSGARCRRVVYWHHHVDGAADRPIWVRTLVGLSEGVGARLLRRTGALVLTSSAATKLMLVAHGLDPACVVHTCNAGSLSVPPTSGTVPAIAKDAPVALFCGRLSRLKGTVDLRRIAARVLSSIDHAVIVICGGDGDDGAALRRDLADASAAGRAIFTGFVDEAAKQALFRRAHVVVVPSHEEGWGVTVGDGLAAGCWVVAYDLPAVRDAFPVGPRYVPVGDPETFAQQVLDCLQRPKPASPQAERLDWETIADREMQLILAT